MIPEWLPPLSLSEMILRQDGGRLAGIALLLLDFLQGKASMQPFTKGTGLHPEVTNQ